MKIFYKKTDAQKVEKYSFHSYLEGPIFCLEENTIIKTIPFYNKKKGGFYRKINDYKLKDLPKDFYVISYNFDKKRKECKKASKIYMGEQDCYEIELENGKKVIATSEHMFFNENGKEIKVKDLKVGDKIVHIKSMSKSERKKHRTKLIGENNPFYGRKHSKATKERISKACIDNAKTNLNYGLRGKKQTKSSCNKMSRTKLKLFSEGKIKIWCKGLTKEGNESLKKISEKMKGENHFNCRGNKNSQWKGGISFQKYGDSFNNILKEKIRNRDSRVCQFCGIKEEKIGRLLSIHHIDYDKKNNKEDNLISLCPKCHGLTTTNRDFWLNYYLEVMNNKCIIQR